ncbi:RNA polymerase sigma factor RpoD [Coleofasciculus sp. FACHB-T130]|nr:RNA polymerase sigma factor RpoD [Coleofasciculus sp. FACHB-T130]
MTLLNQLIEQVIHCCQKRSNTALDDIFENLNEQVLARSLQRLEGDTANWFCTYLKHKLSSVSSILQETTLHQPLGYYPAKEQHTGSEELQKQSRDEVRDRGKRLHEWIENCLNNRYQSCSKDLEPWCRSIEPALRQIQRVLYVEDFVFNLELGYWGKVDCIVQLKGALCLIDWKTTHQPYPVERIHEYKIQCVAYLNAANKTYGLDLRHALIVIALPDQKPQIVPIQLEMLNKYFQEWRQRVERFKTEVLTPGAIITHSDGSTTKVRRVIRYRINKAIETIIQPQSQLEQLFEVEDNQYKLVDVEADESGDEYSEDCFIHPRARKNNRHYTEDSIRIYLQEIGRIRLLRSDEEIEFARKVADLMELERLREQFIKQLNREPQDIEWAEVVLKSECYWEKLAKELRREPQQEEWLKEVKKHLPTFRHRLYIGRRAKDRMVHSNLRLVVSITKKYMNRGLSFQDLIQEGSLGLIRAAENFDHEKGYKFSTYAPWWIRQAITRALADQSRTISLPVHLYETISKIKKTSRLISKEMGRKPTEDEIATRMEMTIEKLQFITKSVQLPISLETPIHVNLNKDPWFYEGDTQEELCLRDLIETDEQTPEDKVSKNLLREDLESVLDTLSPRERDVIRLRYGLDDGRMKTLEEIAQISNVTSERIRQIEAKAIRQLRHPNRNSILKEYIRGNNSYDLRKEEYRQQSEPNQSHTEEVKNDPSHPQDAVAYFNQGVERYQLGNFQGAVEDFTHAIYLNPNYADAYNRRSSAYAVLGNYPKVMEDLQTATNLYLR